MCRLLAAQEVETCPGVVTRCTLGLTRNRTARNHDHGQGAQRLAIHLGLLELTHKLAPPREDGVWRHRRGIEALPEPDVEPEPNRGEVSRQTVEGLANTGWTRQSRGRRQRIRRADVVFGELPQQVAATLRDQTDAAGAVSENKGRDVAREGALIGADVDPADGRADQHERSLFARRLQDTVKVGDCLFDRLVRRPAIAPPQPRAIVRADSRRPGYLRLHEGPVDRKRTTATLKDHRGAAAARAMDVHPAAANVHHAAWRLILRCRLPVQRWRDGQNPEHDDCKPHVPIDVRGANGVGVQAAARAP